MDNLVLATTNQVVEYTHAVSHSEVAAVTILTYDILINFGDEVELIWKNTWTPAKWMYIVARYVPWLFQLALLSIEIDGTTGLFFSESQCSQWQIVQAVILQLIITTVDIILMTRVYALYNRSTPLISILILLFIGEISYMSYLLSIVTPQLEFNSECFVTKSPEVFIAYWIISLSFETLLFLLTLYKFSEAIKNGWGKRPVMKRFVTDGTWAYALVFVTMFINSMLYKFVHNPLAGICFTWLLSVLSFAGSRLILNPRRRSHSHSHSRLTNLSTTNNSHAPNSLGDIPLTPLSPTSHREKSFRKSALTLGVNGLVGSGGSTQSEEDIVGGLGVLPSSFGGRDHHEQHRLKVSSRGDMGLDSDLELRLGGRDGRSESSLSVDVGLGEDFVVGEGPQLDPSIPPSYELIFPRS